MVAEILKTDQFKNSQTERAKAPMYTDTFSSHVRRQSFDKWIYHLVDK